MWFRGTDFQENVEHSLNLRGACTVSKHAWNMPDRASCASFNVQSPAGMAFSILGREIALKVTWEGVSGTILDLSGANPFLSCGPWVSHLVLASRLSSLWNFHPFLMCSACFVR